MLDINEENEILDFVDRFLGKRKEAYLNSKSNLNFNHDIDELSRTCIKCNKNLLEIHLNRIFCK